MKMPLLIFRKYAIHIIALILIPIAGYLIFVLLSALEKKDVDESTFHLLIQLNLWVGGLLLLTIVGLSITLINRLIKGRFGAKITSKVAIYFTLIGLLPGLLIFTVSTQFLGRSIETWFDTNTDKALKAAVELGTDYFDNTKNNTLKTAYLLAAVLAENPNLQLIAISRQLKLTLTLYDQQGTIIHSTDPNATQLSPEQTTALNYQAQFVQVIEDDQSGQPQSINAIVKIDNNSQIRSQTIPNLFAIAVQEPIAKRSGELANQIINTYQDYQLAYLGRVGLKKMYIGTLTLTLLFALFVAIILAMLLGRDIAKPLILLFKGTQDVVAGHLNPITPLGRKDEMGDLITSFNQMTGQLAFARAALEQSNGYLKGILANLSTGVIVMDKSFNILTLNMSAKKILHIKQQDIEGTPIAELTHLNDFYEIIRHEFESLWVKDDLQSLNRNAYWQEQINLPNILSNKDGEPLTIMVRGAYLANFAVQHWQSEQPNFSQSLSTTSAYMVAFDDINDWLAAQRSVAWGEVARRMAHEIKNPLTPIQLSAERLERKLSSALPPDLQHTLHKSVTTIVNQVTAMKRIVDEFRDYAKLPPAQFEAVSINELIQEILLLYGIDHPKGGIAEQAGQKLVRIILDLQPSIPPIKGDPTQIRQIIHNLLSNAIEAFGDNNPNPAITIITQMKEFKDIHQNSYKAVRITISDNGDGFAPKVLSRLFEPYTTTKPNGTGLGLAMIKKMLDEHHAIIDVQNIENAGTIKGAKVCITFRHILT